MRRGREIEKGERDCLHRLFVCFHILSLSLYFSLPLFISIIFRLSAFSRFFHPSHFPSFLHSVTESPSPLILTCLDSIELQFPPFLHRFLLCKVSKSRVFRSPIPVSLQSQNQIQKSLRLVEKSVTALVIY